MRNQLKALLASLPLLGLLPGGVLAQTPQTQCVSNALAGGTVDAIRIPLQPCALSTNILILTLAGANTLAQPTLQMAGYPAQNIYTSTGTAPGIGALPGAGAVVMLTSTGSSWKIVSGNASTTFSGVLTVPNGGTGDSTLTTNGVLIGQGTGAVTAVAAGTTGQYLGGNTASPPSWKTISSTLVSTWSAGTTGFTPSSATSGAVTLAGTLIPANGGTGLTSYTTGDLLYASSSSALAGLTDAATGNALISGGAGVAPSYGKIGLTTHVTGTLAVANGGSGAATFASNGLLYGNTTSAFGAVAAGTTGQLLTAVTGSAPVWTSVPASGVATIGFGTTGLTPAAATGGIVTVAGTLAVANGGTGATTLTGALVGNGTSAVTAGTLTVPNGGSGAATFTNHGVLLGQTAAAFAATAAGTTGQYLKGATGADPSWGTLASDTVSTVGFGTTGLTPSAATAGAVTVAGTLVVSNGGTGVGTLTGIPLASGTSAWTAATAGTDYAKPNTASTWTAKQTFNGSSSVLAAALVNAAEPATISATVATGTINYDVCTQSVLYYTSNASANWTTNFRCSSGTSLNTAMSTGDVVTVTFMVTQGASPFYNNVITVDGGANTPKCQGGTCPGAGNASGIDAYTYAIVKTGNAAFTVLESQTQFK